MKGVLVDTTKGTIEEPVLDRFPKTYGIHAQWWDGRPPVITIADLQKELDAYCDDLMVRMPLGVNLEYELSTRPGIVTITFDKKHQNWLKKTLRKLAVYLLKITR